MEMEHGAAATSCDVESGVALSSLSMMDVFLLPHPDREQADCEPFREFARSWKEKMPKPKSILVISAHWKTSHPTVSAFPHIHQTKYECQINPSSTDKRKYPAPGAPQLAMRVKELLMESGFETVDEDSARGLDIGAWCPLMFMYPEADIPVCEISVQPSKDGTYHYNMGRALAPLRTEGVLIIGSGGSNNHLPPASAPVFGPVEAWALEFDAWLMDCLFNKRHEDVIDYEMLAPHAKMAHPDTSHIYTWIVGLGSAGKGAKVEHIHQSWGNCCVSFAAYRLSNNL